MEKQNNIMQLHVKQLGIEASCKKVIHVIPLDQPLRSQFHLVEHERKTRFLT